MRTYKSSIASSSVDRKGIMDFSLSIPTTSFSRQAAFCGNFNGNWSIVIALFLVSFFFHPFESYIGSSEKVAPTRRLLVSMFFNEEKKHVMSTIYHRHALVVQIFVSFKRTVDPFEYCSVMVKDHKGRFGYLTECRLYHTDSHYFHLGIFSQHSALVVRARAGK